MVKKLFSISILIVVFSLIFSLFVNASPFYSEYGIPYNDYGYWKNYDGSEKTPVYNKPIYQAERVYTYSDMGVEERFKKITDVFNDKDGYTYILDGGSSRVIILDSEYRAISVFSEILSSETGYKFENACGIFADNTDEIYIADTENARIFKCDSKGNLIRKYELPESRLIPSTFNYRPIKVSKDSRGYMYVLSDGSYYGALLYSKDDEFLGFYGANTIPSTLGQVIRNLVNKLVMTNDKRAASESTLPFQFTDIFIDSNDFVFTTTGNVSNSSQKGQIRKLSPGGKNVLKTDSFNYGDVITSNQQDLLSLCVDDAGYIYALDSSYGHIYVYDQQSNLLGAFGGGQKSGVQVGTFTYSTSISINKNDIIVADSTLNTLTVFNETEFGKILKEAQKKTNDGDYAGAKELWFNILGQNRQSQLAYSGLAKAFYEEGKNEEAIKYAKLGCDRETYALAFSIIRNNFLKKNFTTIVISAALLICAMIFLLRKKKKSNKTFYSPIVKTVMSVLKSPSNTFDLIKTKNQGSLIASIVILVLFYVTTVIKSVNSGFAFNEISSSNFNSLLVLLRTVGFVGLFTVSFWGVSTLLAGQGKIKEIFYVVCYSLQPMIIANIIYVVLTNIMLPNEIGFINLFMQVMMLYTAFIAVVGLMRICDYDFFKLLGVTVLAVLGMIVIVFVLIVVFLLFQLLIGFFKTVFAEIYKIVTIGG